MSSNNEQIEQIKLPEFSALDFEVIAVYGAHFEPPEKIGTQTWMEWFDVQRHKESARRKGWTPMYRDHINTIPIDIETSEISLTVEYPESFELDDDPKGIKMKAAREVNIREDGATAITIKLKADKVDAPFKICDILAPLLLAPRMRGENKSDKYKNIAKLTPNLFKKNTDVKKDTQDESIDNLVTEYTSDLFKLFLSTVKEVISKVPELHFEINSSTSKEDSDYEGDIQIPSFAVFATLPKMLYEEVFLDDGERLNNRILKKRKEYTKEIASILLRWLKPQNVKYVSLDYLESLNLLIDGAFVNRYMNSLSFVTYSSTGTLCFNPEEGGQFESSGLTPQEATKGSILRCIELSRLRLHHAIRLNKRLNELTKEVVKDQGNKGFDDYLSELLQLRAEAAIHFLDPFTFQWDTTVGADIAKFLQVDVLEQIENECLQKLDTIKKLIHESLDVFRAKAMHRAALRKQ